MPFSTLELLWCGGFTEDMLFKLLFKIVFNDELSSNPHRQVVGVHPTFRSFSTVLSPRLYGLHFYYDTQKICTHIYHETRNITNSCFNVEVVQFGCYYVVVVQFGHAYSCFAHSCLTDREDRES